MNSTTEKPRVAFLGLGIMGSGMARRLLRAGFLLTVYNRNTEKTAPFATEGASVAATPREAAERADVIISMVADDAASRGLWLGEHNALAGAATGALLIESSTLTVGWVKELANAAAARGCELLDAPVTGSKAHAAAGELNFLVGGTEAALERARPILSAMGRSIVHVGPTGSGARLKLINNFLCGVQLVSLAEAVSLIEKSGLDRAKALEVLTNGAPGSPLVKTVSARMESRDYAPNFPLRLMAKDLGYALGEAGQYRVPLATVAAALKVFEKAVADGHGGEDFSAIVEQYRQT